MHTLFQQINTHRGTVTLFVPLFLFFILYLVVGPIPQPESYHHLADTRDFLGLYGGGDIASNLLFLGFGLLGLGIIFLQKVHFLHTW